MNPQDQNLTASIGGYQVQAYRNSQIPPVIPSSGLIPSPQMNFGNPIVTPTALTSTAVNNNQIQNATPVNNQNNQNQIQNTYQNEAQRGLAENFTVPQDTNAQTTNKNLSQQIFSGLNELSGQTEALVNAKDQAGVNRLRQGLQDINSEIVRKQSEIRQDDLNTAQGIFNINQQKIPKVFTTGQAQSVQEQANLARAFKVSEIDMLNSLALGAQGNITLAESRAKDAVDLKYAPIKDRIATWEAQKKIVEVDATADERKQLAAQQRKYDLLDKEVEDKKKQDLAKQNILINGSSQNAPADLMAKAKNAKTPSEAAMILGQYAGDYYAIEKIKSEIKKNNAEAMKISNAERTRMQSAGNGGSGGSGTGSGVNGSTGQTPEGAAWLTNVRNGKAQFSDVPSKFKNEVSLGLASTDNAITNVNKIQPTLFKDASARTNYTNLDSVVRAASAIKNSAVDGQYAGLGVIIGTGRDWITSKEGMRNRGFLAALELKTQQWASGASLTESQVALVRKMLPEQNDTDSVVTKKLDSFTEYMNNEKQSVAASQGQNLVETKSNTETDKLEQILLNSQTTTDTTYGYK